MGVRARLLSAVASDTGRRRTNNEDRYFTDPDHGIFAVIDGVGGHAAGEHAADTAVQVLSERLERQTGTPEERLREAIALANNEIYRQASLHAEWRGMACVLTIALIEDDVVTVGHVGDSRLYVLRAGEIHKMTHDHSPVGEREDRGELTEADAMSHPRRNEIYRDVGSGERAPDDPSFIEILSFPMPADGALLICSDGLSDLVSSAEIRAGVERYAPDYDGAIQALIEAANAAGGKDNITIAVVASPGFKPEAALVEAPAKKTSQAFAWQWPAAALAVGLLLGSLGTVVTRRMLVSGPQTFLASAGGINTTLSQAHSGDTVLIPPGKYRERIQLREGVVLRAQQSSTVTLLSPDGGPVVTANNIATGSLEDVWILGDPQSPAITGVELIDASPTLTHVRISGAITGVKVSGSSAPLITANQLANNLGAGILVSGTSHARIENNLIAANGNGKPGIDQPGVDVQEQARPILKDNAIVDNAAEPVWVHGREYQKTDFEENFYGGLTLKEAVKR